MITKSMVRFNRRHGSTGLAPVGVMCYESMASRQPGTKMEGLMEKMQVRATSSAEKGVQPMPRFASQRAMNIPKARAMTRYCASRTSLRPSRGLPK